jgi:hypothetical protein
MTSRRKLDEAQQKGFAHLDNFDATHDPAELRAAADLWRWVAQSTSDQGQRSYMLAAVSVAMRRYYDRTKELWALQDGINAARAAVQSESNPHRWAQAALYQGITEYMFFKATGQQEYLDDSLVVMRAAAKGAQDEQQMSSVLSHLGEALRLAYEKYDDEQLLDEAIDVGREAIRLDGPLFLNSVTDLMVNLRTLAGVRKDDALLREGEGIGRWAAENATVPGDRGWILFELSRTLADLARHTGDPTIMADAVAAGEGSLMMARGDIERQLRGTVIDGMRDGLRKMSGPENLPMPPV